MILFILFIVFLIILLYLVFSEISNVSYLKKRFENGNVIVYGQKGKGKDLLFQKVINKRKNKKYFSNIDYGKKYNAFDMTMIDLTPNTFENMIENNIIKINDPLGCENSDIYISDGGIYYPSQYDTLLNKKYRSLGLAYALSRHLWNNNIHVNTQALSRVWKLLREQADTYIKCRHTIKLPFILVTFYTIYDKYASAENDIRPIKSRFRNKVSKAETDIYNGTNGIIKNGFIVQLKRSVKYDTRIFKKIIFESQAASIDN